MRLITNPVSCAVSTRLLSRAFVFSPMSLAPLLFAVAFSTPIPAQEKEEIKKLGEKFVDDLTKAFERRTSDRIAKLEEELKARDKKIVELETKVKDLAGGKPPQALPGPGPAAFLGVSHIEPSAEVRSRLKIENGALVTNVIENSPAALAGIQANDVIVAVNGMDVTSGNLTSVVSALRPDQEINLVYVHDGTKVTKTAKLVDREKFLASNAKAPAEPKKEPVVLGVVAVEKDGAIFIESVEDGLTGFAAGLKKDDKLTHLNGKEVKSLEDIVGELKKTLDGDTLKIVYVRGDETIRVEIVGSHGKEGIKVVSSKAEKKAEPAKEAKKETPPAEKKPGLLGIAVVPDAGGIVVDSVQADTAAAAAGVAKGDAIKKLNGQDVSDVGQLKESLSKLSAGEKVSLLLVRGGQSVELKDITLGVKGEKVAAVAKPEQPKEAPKPAAEPKPVEKPKKPGRVGILARETDDSKVVIKTVNSKSAAEKAGLKPEDVIIKVNDKAISNFDDLTAVFQTLFAGDTVTVRVKRGEEEKELKLILAEPGADEAANP